MMDTLYLTFFIRQLSDMMDVDDIKSYLFRVVFLHLDDISLGRCYQLVLENTDKHKNMLLVCDYPNKLIAEAYKVVISSNNYKTNYTHIWDNKCPLPFIIPYKAFNHGRVYQYLINHHEICEKAASLLSSKCFEKLTWTGIIPTSDGHTIISDVCLNIKGKGCHNCDVNLFCKRGSNGIQIDRISF